MSDVNRFWAGSLHSVEPSCLAGQPYVKYQVVFASAYDALLADRDALAAQLEKLRAAAERVEQQKILEQISKEVQP